MSAPASDALGDLLARWRVLPVVTLDDATSAIAVARACHRGGLSALEVTLRTAGALDAIRAITAEVPGVTVGAGSVLDAAQFEAARLAGASFAVSPGCLPALVEAAQATGVPWLPGVASASDILLARSAGYRTLKFFPAATAGGPAALHQFAGPFPDVRFCPTGGITAATMPEWLALPNVCCVGGSWIADSASISGRHWEQVTARAAAARSEAGRVPPSRGLR